MTLLRAIGCTFLVSVLLTAGLCTWRFGPWYKSGEQNAQASSMSLSLDPPPCDSCCNLLPSNCDLPVNQVLFPTVHNAMSSYNDYFVAANNNDSLENALLAGFRGLMLDSCLCDGGIEQYVWDKAHDIVGTTTTTSEPNKTLGFCHTYCDAGVRDPAIVLDNIYRFMEANPNEVLLLEFEINDNSLSQLFQAIDQSGLDKFIYRPPYNSNNSLYTMEWPTLQTLIDNNSRLLLFAHGDNMTSCTKMTCPEGIMYTYDHFAQTPMHDSQDCNATVSNDQLDLYSYFLMNHFQNDDYDLPSIDNAKVLNTYQYLDDRMRTCDIRLPTILAVDFWDVGQVLTFAKDSNVERAMKKKKNKKS